MKKVLLISFFFSKKESVGALRARGLATYLPKFGWEPTILTAGTEHEPESEFNIVETGYVDVGTKWKQSLGLDTKKSVREQLGFRAYKDKSTVLDFAVNCWEQIFLYPDGQRGWYLFALREGRRLLEQGNYDAIVSTSSPVSAHLIAAQLKTEMNIPWIADLRDLWTQNHNYHYGRARRLLDRRTEIKTLSDSDAIVTVSAPWAEKLRLLHGRKEVHSILNGFNPAIENKGAPVDKEFSIAYTGYIYKGRQDPEPFFKAISELVSKDLIDRSHLRIRFYGHDDGWLQHDIEKYRLKDVVTIYGQVSRNQVLQVQRSSQILLLLTWNDPSVVGHYPAKIFEYLAARRPILSIGRFPGVVADVLAETNAGVTASEVDEIEKELLRLYKQFLQTGATEPKSSAPLEKYTQVRMASEYAELLNSVVEKSK